MAFVILAAIVILLLAGAPLFIIIGAATAFCIMEFSYAELVMVVQPMFSIVEKEALLAVPLFIIASTFMTRGSGAKRLVAFIRSLFGWLPGGLALATIGSCLVFTALAGFSPASIIAVGSTMLPGLVKSGYSERFSLGLVTSSGALGILVPPSIVVLIFGVVAGGVMTGARIPATVSSDITQEEMFVPGGAAPDMMDMEEMDPDMFVPGGMAHENMGDEMFVPGGMEMQTVEAPRVTIEALFIAGVIPILLLTIAFMAYAIVIGAKNRVERDRFSVGDLLSSLKAGFWPVLLPVIIAGGIMSGKMTVTQASSVAAVYAFVMEFGFFRSLNFKRLPSLMREAGVMVGMLLIIISITFSFNWFLTEQEIPMLITEWISSHFNSSVSFLIAVNVVLLFMGCLMDILSAVFITVPLLLPAAVAMGIHPVHFGVIFIVNFEIGYLTPPVGINLFTSGAVFKKPVDQVARSVLPFLVLMLIVLIFITYYPPASLWLVELTGNL